MQSAQTITTDGVPDKTDYYSIAVSAYSIATRYFVMYQRKNNATYSDEAIEKIKEAIQALEQLPTLADNKLLLSQYYYKKGEIYFFVEDFKAALDSYQRAIYVYAEDRKEFDVKQSCILAYYYHACGETYVYLENWQEARNTYEKILALEKISFSNDAVYLRVRALCFLCEQYAEDKKWKKTINYAEQIIPLVNQLNTDHIYKKDYLITAYKNLCIAYDETFKKKKIKYPFLAMIELELNSDRSWEFMPACLEDLLPRFNACLVANSLAAQVWQQVLDIFDPSKGGNLHQFYNLYAGITETPPHQDLLSYRLLIIYMRIILEMVKVVQPSSADLIHSLKQKPEYLKQFLNKLKKLQDATMTLRIYTENHPSIYFVLISKQKELEEKNKVLEKRVQTLEASLVQIASSAKLSASNLFRPKSKEQEKPMVQLASSPCFGHKRSHSE